MNESATLIRARDLMQRDLVTLAAGTSIREAVTTLEMCRISGAPVVDAAGRAIGVLSAADIARGDHVRGGRIESERWEYYLANPLEEEVDDRLSGDEDILAKQDYSDGTAGEQRVEDWMTAHVISVDPEADLSQVCRVMRDENIHRVLVTDKNALVGIISTFDVVRHLAAQ
ncbi:MAG: CBS domain-containing protein [Planctomycetota bacterium]|nr:CBS domain-containing protein [Planctomycetota bacterium]